MAMLFCLFFSSLEYTAQNQTQDQIEIEDDATEEREDTFLNVAVDAVVPFAVHVTQAVMHIIYSIVTVEGQVTEFQTEAVGFTASLGEVFFERVISTQGP